MAANHCMSESLNHSFNRFDQTADWFSNETLSCCSEMLWLCLELFSLMKWSKNRNLCLKCQSININFLFIGLFNKINITFQIHFFEVCHVGILLVAGWFGSWLITLKRRRFKIPLGKIIRRIFSQTKAAEKWSGTCCALL